MSEFSEIRENYVDYLAHAVEVIKHKKVPRKFTKILKRMYKEALKMDDITFVNLQILHMNYMNMMNVTEDDIEEFISAHSQASQQITNNDELIMIKDPKINIMGTTDNAILSKFNKIKWIKNPTMELTIGKNGSMWMNESLWNHLSDLCKYEISGPTTPYNKIDDPDYIELNMGYDKENVLISMKKMPLSLMAIKFHKEYDSNGNIYATIDDKQSFRIQLETSFSFHGVYNVYDTNYMGILAGERKVIK